MSAEPKIDPSTEDWAITVPLPTTRSFAWLMVQTLACAGALGLGAFVQGRLGGQIAAWVFKHGGTFQLQVTASLVPPLVLASVLALAGVISGLRRRWWVAPVAFVMLPALASIIWLVVIAPNA